MYDIDSRFESQSAYLPSKKISNAQLEMSSNVSIFILVRRMDFFYIKKGFSTSYDCNVISQNKRIWRYKFGKKKGHALMSYHLETTMGMYKCDHLDKTDRTPEITKIKINNI